MESIFHFISFIIALLVTLTVHESSHALAAFYLGDPTAKFQGRISLNPVRHLDLLGSVVFLVTQRIGWGKPVPIDPRNFKNPIRDQALTALAGPASNFVLAFALTMPWKYLDYMMPDFLLLQIQYIFHISIFLGIFNLLPIPPLDGSKILGLIVPRAFYRQYANYLAYGAKYFVVIILVDIFILGGFLNFSILAYVLTFLAKWVQMILFLGA